MQLLSACAILLLFNPAFIVGGISPVRVCQVIAFTTIAFLLLVAGLVLYLELVEFLLKESARLYNAVLKQWRPVGVRCLMRNANTVCPVQKLWHPLGSGIALVTLAAVFFLVLGLARLQLDMRAILAVCAIILKAREVHFGAYCAIVSATITFILVHDVTPLRWCTAWMVASVVWPAFGRQIRTTESAQAESRAQASVVPRSLKSKEDEHGDFLRALQLDSAASLVSALREQQGVTCERELMNSWLRKQHNMRSTGPVPYTLARLEQEHGGFLQSLSTDSAAHMVSELKQQLGVDCDGEVVNSWLRKHRSHKASAASTSQTALYPVSQFDRRCCSLQVGPPGPRTW